MMPVPCPACQRPLNLGAVAPGMAARCPCCQHVFRPAAAPPVVLEALPVSPPAPRAPADAVTGARAARRAPAEPATGAGPVPPRPEANVNGKPDGDRDLAWPWRLLAAVPAGIPVLTLGGVIWIALGLGLCSACGAIVTRRRWSRGLRIALPLSIAAAGYAVVGVFYLILFANRPPDAPALPESPNSSFVWKDFEPPGAGVRVALPGDLKPSDDERIDRVRGENFRVYVVQMRKPKCSYVVTTLNRPGPEARENDGPLDRHPYDALGYWPEAAVGRDRVITWRDGGISVTRAYFTENHVCILSVSGQDVDPKAAEVRRFLDSPRRTDGADFLPVSAVVADPEAPRRPPGRTLANPFAQGGVLVVSPDGRLAVTSCDGCALLAWDLDSGTEKYRVVRGEKWDRGEFSPDSKLLATILSSGRELALWDAQTGDLTGTTAARRGGENVHNMAFTPDGSLLFIGAFNGLEVRQLPKLSDYSSFRYIGPHGNFSQLRVAPDGKVLTGIEWGQVFRIEASFRGGKEWPGKPPGKAMYLQPGPRGKMYVIGQWSDAGWAPDAVEWQIQPGIRMRLWDAETGELVPGFDLAKPDGRDPVAVGGGRYAVGSGNGRALVYDTMTGKRLVELLLPFRDGVRLAVSPDGRRVAAVGGRKLLLVYDLVAGRVQMVGDCTAVDHRGPQALLFSPTGNRVLVSGATGAVNVWDLPPGGE
jgi:WD40 repeat protein